MPTLTRWYIRSSLLYLLAALLLGAALALGGPLALPAWLAGWTPVYFHLFMLGWVTQLIFGVVFWMFPKASPERPSGSHRLGWLSYAALNLGLLLRAAAEPMLAASDQPIWRWGLALSATLQWLAGLAFVANTWPRVRGR
jgi:hypothetical protein